MINKADYALADTVMMKKRHACQANDWEILRLGADIRLKCMGCGHIMLMSRADFNQRLKKVLIKHDDLTARRSQYYIPVSEIAQPNWNQPK
ncbi:MAG: DUF951 domain-containing protein [Lactobacillus sp.]|nr:DUF951 domain-containing protein [Lactobacillus sp.]MDN6053010.1 DUF951 domain-containing protein [Lactobacillus sp.]